MMSRSGRLSPRFCLRIFFLPFSFLFPSSLLLFSSSWIGKIRDALGEDDILIVQADHGNDPTIGHPHHTREMVPLMIHSAHSTPKNIGIRKTLSDVGATAADYFHSKAPENGTSFLPLLLK